MVDLADLKLRVAAACDAFSNSLHGICRGFESAQVEVMGRFLNHCDQEERLRSLLELVPSLPQKAKPRTKKHVCRQLRPPEVEKLIAAYQAGVPIKELVPHQATFARFTSSRSVLS